VSAITMAELAAGPHATAEPAERARRQDRLKRAEATFEPLPVDAEVARAYGRVGPQGARPARSGSIDRCDSGRSRSALVHSESGRFRWLVGPA
jgi:predicted nucleic acid-binding protein